MVSSTFLAFRILQDCRNFLGAMVPVGLSENTSSVRKEMF